MKKAKKGKNIQNTFDRYISSLERILAIARDNLDINDLANRIDEEISSLNDDEPIALFFDELQDELHSVFDLEGKEVTIIMASTAYFPFQKSLDNKIEGCVLISPAYNPGEPYIFLHKESGQRFCINPNSSSFIGMIF